MLQYTVYLLYFIQRISFNTSELLICDCICLVRTKIEIHFIGPAYSLKQGKKLTKEGIDKLKASSYDITQKILLAHVTMQQPLRKVGTEKSNSFR